MKSRRLLAAVLVFTALGTSAQAQACNAEVSVAGFQKVADRVLNQIPSIGQEVNNCFNPSKAEYMRQAHDMLVKMDQAYQTASDKLSRAGGDKKALSAAIDETVILVGQANKPVIDNARNLRNFGFTTSDRKEGGRFKYPNCNSQVNNKPEKQFEVFFADVQVAQNLLKTLRQSQACLK